MHPCVRPSKMDDRYGGHENTEKDFLTYYVRHLSRLYVGKNNGQEVFWNLRPPNLPEHLSWKNPTSSPKDSTEILREKFEYLKSQIPNERLTREEQKAFQDFENKDIKNVKSFMCRKKWTDQINNMRKGLRCLQPSDLMLLQRDFTSFSDELSLLLSSATASASSCATAVDTSSSSAASGKRRGDSRTSVPSKRSKTEVLNTNILLKPSSQTACNEQSRIFVPFTIESLSPSLESPFRSTACLDQTQSSFGISNRLKANKCPDTSQCTTSSCHTEAAAATNVQPSIPASSSRTASTICNPKHCGSHDDLPKKLSLNSTKLSVDRGAWSQESHSCKETCDFGIDGEKLKETNVQKLLQEIHDCYKAVCGNSDSATVQDEDFDSKMFSCLDT